MTERDHQERLRSALALLKATATDDRQRIDAITNTSDLRQLASDVALIAIGFIGLLADDPAAHVDLMFHAADVARG